MELFEASVRIVKPGLRRVEEQEKSPDEQMLEDVEGVGKVYKKLEEVVDTMLVQSPRCPTTTTRCCPDERRKIRAMIVRMLEKHEYKPDQYVEYLDAIIKKPELIASLLNDPVY